jgi:ribosomal protein S27AE
MSEVDFGIDLDSIVRDFEDKPQKPIEPVVSPCHTVEETSVEIPKAPRRERPDCPHCGKELSMYAGHPTVHWYCFSCLSFILEKDLREKK